MERYTQPFVRNLYFLEWGAQAVVSRLYTPCPIHNFGLFSSNRAADLEETPEGSNAASDEIRGRKEDGKSTGSRYYSQHHTGFQAHLRWSILEQEGAIIGSPNYFFYRRRQEYRIVWSSWPQTGFTTNDEASLSTKTTVSTRSKCI